jgi:putative transposase
LYEAPYLWTNVVLAGLSTGAPLGYNAVESPFAALRLRADAARRYKKVASATAVIWKMLLVAEQRSRKLDAPEKTMQVFPAVDCANRPEPKREEVLAVS